MKVSKAIILLTLITTLFMTGCMKQPEIKLEQIKSVEDIKIESFTKNIGTYVGKNFDIMNILGKLPGGETIKEIGLSDESIKAAYGYDEEILPKEKLLEYWHKNDTLEENFLFNATLLTILVPNSKEYHFVVDKSSFSVSRNDMVQVLSDNLNNFPNEEEIWEKETVEKFLKENEDAIHELVNSPEFRAEFFKKFPIQEK